MRATVLVVDDNADNRALAEATLDDEGYTVVLAKDGAEAIAAFERARPDCILLDVQMPGMDGVTACGRIRALPGGEDVAIVFVTAQRDVETFDRALAAGGDDFLTKPVRPADLIVRVQAALRLRKLAGERSELYAEVVRQRADLQRLQLQKEQLAGFLVHDLKNPVGAIELQAQRILRDPAATDRTRSAGNAIRDDARALLRMILNLLDLSKADEGRLVPARTQLEPAAFVGAIVDEMRARATASSIELAIDVRAETLAADPDLLHRVLAHLIDNAIRHAPESSTITVRATRAEAATELRVCDQGAGVPAEQRAVVFDRFETRGTSHNRGLGLAFCKLAVEAHGGTIWIEDAAPGAVFCMRFPDGT